MIHGGQNNQKFEMCTQYSFFDVHSKKLCVQHIYISKYSFAGRYPNFTLFQCTISKLHAETITILPIHQTYMHRTMHMYTAT